MNNNDNNNNNGSESLVQEWGRLLVRQLIPDLVPENHFPECHGYGELHYEVVEREIKKKIPKVKEVEETCQKVNVGRQYLTKELIPVAGGSLTHPTAARSNKIFAAAIKVAEKISREDIQRMTTGKNEDVFMVSCNKRSFFASTMKQNSPLKLASNLLHCSNIFVFLKNGSQTEVVSTSHNFWNENIEKIVVLVPVLKLPIRLPYVITHNGRYFTMKLDEINLERFCQERTDNIPIV